MGYGVEAHALTRGGGSLRGVDSLDLRTRRGRVYGFLGPKGQGRSATLAVFAVVVCVLSGCTGDAVPSGAPLSAMTRYLDERLPTLMDRYGVPGLAVAIVRDGEVAWAAGYGYADLETGRPMTADTICRAESISKSVTAWGVMKLVESGALNLSDPVVSHVDGLDLRGAGFDRGAVTVEHLLSHRSGLPLGTIGPPSEYAPGEPRPSPREFVGRDSVIVRSPGSGFLYSDVGFNTLELVVEAVTGERFGSFMQREVLTPLGMSDSSYAWRERYANDLARGHEMDGTPVAPYVYPASASGGLFVDVEDVARFVAAGGGVDSDWVRSGVLSAESLTAIYQPRVEIPGIYGFVADAYGFGHFIETLPDGRRAVWHGGQGHGWMTHFHLVPDSGDGIVILTNSQRAWPLIASVLPVWARWIGVDSVRFGVIVPATRGFWVLTAIVAALALWRAYRVVAGLREGSRRVAPLAPENLVRRIAEFVGGLGLIALVVWRISLPYVDEASVFPAAAPWAAVSFIAMGVVLVGSSLAPTVAARRPQPGEPPREEAT